MTVRFATSAANRLSIASGVFDYNAAWAFRGFFQIVTDTNATAQIFSVSDGTANNADIVRLSTDGTTLVARIVVGAANTEVSGTNLTVGVDYFICGVRESATSFKVYLAAVGSVPALDITTTRDVTGRAASSLFRVGSSATGSQRFEGRASALAAYTATKTLAEVQNMAFALLPRDREALWGWWPTWPGATERARDYSGNGRNWTEDGTLTDEDPPPVQYGTRTPQMSNIIIPAAAGNPWYAYAQQ